MEPRERREDHSTDGFTGASQNHADTRNAPGWELVFPKEHALSLVWTVWTKERREEDMRLNLWSDELKQLHIDESRLAQENRRIQIWLTKVARARLMQMADSPSLDEGAVIFLSSDAMVAWLLLLPAVGEGKQLSASQIHQALMRRGVTYGICWNTICEMSECPQRNFHIFTIACGKMPVRGQDGAVVDRYPRVLEANLKVDELGAADYEALNLVQDIREGDVICDIVLPTKGKSGRTVTGKAVAAAEGHPAQVPQGRNTCLSEDGTQLLAQRDGHLYFSGRSFQVKPVLHLYEDHFPSEPSIKFLGDIHIHGDLCGDVSVYAIGNVQIDGVIEGCKVEAGENIIVSSGVLGQDRAVLHAQKSVYAKYLEHCSVYAVESVQADCIISSNVYSNGDVRVRTGRGAVVGGIIRAAREVSAITIGSKAERETQVMLGGKPCEEAERMQIAAEIQEIERAMAQDREETSVSKLRLRQCVAKMKLEKIEKDLEEDVKRNLESDCCRMQFDTAYPGTSVSMRHLTYHVEREMHDGTIGLNNGAIRRI